MGQGNDQEKTEPASPKKREDARGKGQVAQSREIPSVLILFSALGVFMFAGNWMFNLLSEFMSGYFQHLDTMRFDDIHSARTLLSSALGRAGLVMAPVVVAVLIAGVAGNVIQVGWLFTTEPLMPKLEKLSPLKGIKRMVSLKMVMETLKSILKVVLVGSLAYAVILKRLDDMPGLMQVEVGEILAFAGRTSFVITFYICLSLIALALFDYVFQRWNHEKELRMTKQEVKDEQRQTLGDPKVKAKIKRLQREMAMQRMMNAVPDADVVITNPTRLAIAVRFDPETMDAPEVLAKGAGHVARRIREIARAHHVPLVEQKPLAQALFKAVAIGEFIPADLYRAVAEVLAYVYRLRGRPQA
jgi:flagellar biosynthesis protein FlhB